MLLHQSRLFPSSGKDGVCQTCVESIEECAGPGVENFEDQLIWNSVRAGCLTGKETPAGFGEFGRSEWSSSSSFSVGRELSAQWVEGLVTDDPISLSPCREIPLPVVDGLCTWSPLCQALRLRFSDLNSKLFPFFGVCVSE